MRTLKWFLMLNKRLYKKASFIAILILVPLCVMLFSSVSKQDKGFLHIILVQTESRDKVSSEIIDDFMSESSIIRFSTSDSAEKAVEAVKNGSADEAWIFPKDTENKIQNFVTLGDDKFITVIAREDTVFSMLSREKLSSALFEYTARAYYLDFARTNLSELDYLSDEELNHYFDTVSIDEELFEFSSDSSKVADGKGGINYLTTPIRGFMGVLILICGMASAMYLIGDEKAGTFSWAKESHKLWLGFISMIIAVLNISVAVFISLAISGLSADILTEVLSLLIYAVSVTAFSMALKYILCSIKLYAALIPLISILSLALCPVFFDSKSKLVPHLLPPTYYINSIYNRDYMLYMILYTLALVMICTLLHILKKIRNKNFR